MGNLVPQPDNLADWKNNGQNNKKEEDITREEHTKKDRLQDTDGKQTEDWGRKQKKMISQIIQIQTFCTEIHQGKRTLVIS